MGKPVNFMAQYPTPLSDEANNCLPEFVLSIPSILIRGVAVIEVERRVTAEEIKKRNAVASSNWSGKNHLVGGEDLDGFQSLSEMVSGIKEQCVQEDIKKLGELIELSFRDQLEELGVSPDDPRLRQEIEKDLTFLDLHPGDTEIHYRIFTKRRLALLNGPTN